MGSSQVKDQNIDLYVSTNKQFYVAGQCVEGEVCLNVKTNRQYSNLSLRLTGVQHVYWTTGSGKNRRSHSNTYKSYQMYNLLVDFHGTANQGQYLFPFAMMLPAMMCGSYLFSSSCYIKYLLRTELVHPTDEKHTQSYEMYLNILEPPRIPLGAVSITNSVHAQCCGCCTDYGTTSVTLNSSKNFVINGENIVINGLINNSQGKEKIQNWVLALEQRRVMISAGGRVIYPVDQQYIVTNNGGIVEPGASKQFSFNYVIPQNIFSYTAIGRVTGRYFVLHLSTDYGCCTQTANAMLHIIVHSRTPMIIQKKHIPPPQNWAPQVYPRLIVQNMKPYLYMPLPAIPFRNMPGGHIIIKTNPDTNFQQMNENLYQMTPDFQIPETDNKFNYNPIFYQQDMFTEAEKQQQGYYQPYFNQSNTQYNDNNIVKKL